MFKFWKNLLLFKFYILDEPPIGGGSVSEPPLAEPRWDDNVEYPEGVDETIKGDPTLKAFVKDNKINYANLMKSYINAQKLVGRDKVVLPNHKSSQEEWDNFYSKMGRPALDKYEIKTPEGSEVDKDFLSQFKETAYKQGLLPKQAEELFNWYNTTLSSKHEEMVGAQTQKIESEHFALKKEWGMGFDKEIDLAKRALRQFASEDEIKLFKEAGLTGDVRFIKLMNKIGKGLKEDSFSHESAGNFGITKQEAQNKINSMYADSKGAYMNKAHPGHKGALDEMLKLNEIISS
jgi:hypothetical protein